MAEHPKIQIEFAERYQDLKLLKRRWFPMWTLDGYILKEFLIKYMILMLIFVTLFILSDVYRDVPDFLEEGASWKGVFLYLLLRLPGNVRFVLPISMLLGCMWTMAAFGKNLEVTAMRASGVSLARCGGAIMAMGLAVTALNIYFNESLVPRTSVMSEQLFDRLTNSNSHAKSLLAYKSDDGKRRWLFQLFVSGEKQENVTLKTQWDPTLIGKLLGDEGSEKYENTLKSILGIRYEQLPPVSEKEKRKQEIHRLLNGRKIDFTIEKSYYDKLNGQWVFESGNFVSYDRAEETLFAGSRGTMLLHQGINFTDLRFPAAEIPEKPDDILHAVEEKDNLSTPVIMNILENNKNIPDNVRCIYETVLYYRLAFPWSCFLAVFLGIPLATRNERTGSMLAIISAIALIVIYIVIAQIFLILGKSGILDPLFCGLAPTVAFIVAGGIKIVHDRV